MSKLKEPRYINPDDVQRRLDQCIVLFKGRPVWSVYAGGHNVTLMDLVSHKKIDEYVHGDEEDLDVRTPPLGFVNFNDSIVYMMRRSGRNQKTGLELASAIYVWPDGSGRQVGSNVDFLRGLGQSILNEYPSFDEARAAVTKGRSMAFHRRMALGTFKDVPMVFYRGQAVGLYSPNTNKVNLLRDYINSPIEARLSEYIKVLHGQSKEAP